MADETQAPPRGANHPTRWWLASALLLVVTAIGCGLLGNLALQPPEDGTDANAMAAMSCFALSGLFAVMALASGMTYLVVWVRSRRSTVPGWYADPTGRSSLRWWDGIAWTDWTA